MSNVQQKLICVFGLGMSGIAAARYLNRINRPFIVVDTRQNPPEKVALQSLENCIATYFGQFSQDILNKSEMIIVSPGISAEIESIVVARENGVEIVGDVEIFARETKRKVIAITGSNGKSTVTDLTHQLLKASGLSAQIGGNFGVPVLDFLPQDQAEIYVLELSRFQLDTTRSLKADVAVVLNISEDHMDRYTSFEAYRQSKLSIYNDASTVICNADDRQTKSELRKDFIEFGLTDNSAKYHLRKDGHSYWLMKGETKVVDTAELSVTGKHNWSNALAAIAIVSELGIELDNAAVTALKTYKGLAHRFQLVASNDGNDWVNDSKATNVGATQAALDGIDTDHYSSVVLIAGGDAKGGDLSPLKKTLQEKVSHLVLIGKDAKLFAALFDDQKVSFASSMYEAVETAKSKLSMQKGKKGLVLLSPACASLDMYKNFVARGEAFIEAVEAVA